MSRCGSCTLCCRVTSVPELRKPVGKWCSHVEAGVGCRIYDRRPNSCRSFECYWYSHSKLSAHLRPNEIGVMFEQLKGKKTILALVDPDRPQAWRMPNVQAFISSLTQKGNPVLVSESGVKPVVLLPEGWTRDDVQREVTETVNEEVARMAKESGRPESELFREWLVT